MCQLLNFIARMVESSYFYCENKTLAIIMSSACLSDQQKGNIPGKQKVSEFLHNYCNTIAIKRHNHQDSNIQSHHTCKSHPHAKEQ